MHMFILFTVIVFFPVISGFCHQGWEEHYGLCYYFSPNTTRYSRANRHCKDLRADLAMAKNQFKNTFINETKVPDELYWIGLSKKSNRWKWSDGELLASTYLNWKSGTPVAGTLYRCVHFAYSGHWSNLLTCNLPLRYICQKLAIANP